MARKKKEPEPKAGCPEWLATYGDLVTLVLTFFVLLFSFSTIDVQKWKDVVASLSGTPSIFEGLNMTNNPNADKRYEPSQTAEIDLEHLMENSDEWEELVEAVKNMLAQSEQTIAGEGDVSSDATQIKIELSGDILFDSGSDVLKEGAAEILADIVNQLNPYLPLIGKFDIQGHTDNVPIDTYRFPNNWYLSQARAASVLTYLLNVFKDNPDYPPSMFYIGGYGEYHPIDTNDTPEGRQKNRRVTFVIMKESNINTDLPITVSPDEVPVG